MKRSQFSGYLSTPPSGSGPPVLVLHAWWGLNEFVKDFCERLSNSGFTAYAPDLYQGKVTEQISEAESLSAELFDNLDQTRAVLAEAVSFFTRDANQDQQNLAVIGFSLGAFFALDLSVTNPELIHSVVLFYGTRPGDYRNAKAAYLGHFAEQDKFEPQSAVEELEKDLLSAGCTVNFYQYPGTGHWFFESNRRQAFDQALANLAWDRTLEFLRRSE